MLNLFRSHILLGDEDACRLTDIDHIASPMLSCIARAAVVEADNSASNHLALVWNSNLVSCLESSSEIRGGKCSWNSRSEWVAVGFHLHFFLLGQQLRAVRPEDVLCLDMPHGLVWKYDCEHSAGHTINWFPTNELPSLVASGKPQHLALLESLGKFCLFKIRFLAHLGLGIVVPLNALHSHIIDFDSTARCLDMKQMTLGCNPLIVLVHAEKGSRNSLATLEGYVDGCTLLVLCPHLLPILLTKTECFSDFDFLFLPILHHLFLLCLLLGEDLCLCPLVDLLELVGGQLYLFTQRQSLLDIFNDHPTALDVALHILCGNDIKILIVLAPHDAAAWLRLHALAKGGKLLHEEHRNLVLHDPCHGRVDHLCLRCGSSHSLTHGFRATVLRGNHGDILKSCRLNDHIDIGDEYDLTERVLGDAVGG